MFPAFEIYLRSINWEKRLKLELPLLEELISHLQKCTANPHLQILDLGCGPGIHISKLGAHFPDCSFTGLDADEKSIKYAHLQQAVNNTNIQFIHSTFPPNANTAAPIEMGQYDFIFSVGNSLSLIWGETSPEKVLACLAKHLNPGGSLFFQILNNERPRSGYLCSDRFSLPEGDTAFIAKRFDPWRIENKMAVEFLSFFQPKGQTKVHVEVQQATWPLISETEIDSLLAKFGINIHSSWENYGKAPFASNLSDNLLILGQKR